MATRAWIVVLDAISHGSDHCCLNFWTTEIIHSLSGRRWVAYHRDSVAGRWFSSAVVERTSHRHVLRWSLRYESYRTLNGRWFREFDRPTRWTSKGMDSDAFEPIAYFHTAIPSSRSILCQLQNEERNREFSTATNAEAEARVRIGPLKIDSEVIVRCGRLECIEMHIVTES